MVTYERRKGMVLFISMIFHLISPGLRNQNISQKYSLVIE
jgi:hypothetical protein